MSLSIVILAAGKGTRMKSATPKVLHTLAGKPLLGHVVDTARQLQADKISIVYGHGGELLPQAFAEQADLQWALQEPQLGTAHAVQQAIEHIQETDKTLILYGDVPLTPLSTLQNLLSAVSDQSMSLLTAELDNPTGYGRIVRDAAQQVTAIVEQKDANAEQLTINEINSGIMALPTAKLIEWLSRIDNNNAQQEYYLTDVIALAVTDAIAVEAIKANCIEDVSGINSRGQLVQLERYWQQQLAENLANQGVTIRDPARFDVRGNLIAGQDVEIDVNVVFAGNVQLGNNVVIEANCVIQNTTIGDGTTIHANSVIDQASIGNNCNVGPFARIRPESVLADEARIGNFVEVKKASIGHGSKVNHLSYVGDAEVGSQVNIGAGTITCNYDGANKHLTKIANNVFVGSDTQLVAPVNIGEGATIGAGSTITKDVAAGKLTLSRSKQVTLSNWQRPVKQKK